MNHKKNLLYFLIEKSYLTDEYDGLTLDEIREQYLNYNSYFKGIDSYIDLFLNILYDKQLIKVNNCYNIRINKFNKCNKIFQGEISGLFKKVKLSHEVKQLEDKINFVSRRGNFLTIITTKDQKITYFIPNISSGAYYVKQFKRLEKYRGLTG